MKRPVLCATAFGAIGGLALLTLAACDSNPSAVPARIESAEAPVASAPARAMPAVYTTPEAASDARPSARTERGPAPLLDGTPIWADNRSHTAQENAAYQFEHHGAELGAKDLDDFVRRAHRFVGSPPAGVKVKTRSNGDRLMFDPASGLFAVARSDGAPRTVFKPEEGLAYWEAQSTTSRGGTRTARRTSGRDQEDAG